MKFNQILTTFVKRDLANGSIPMLLGEPGIGKSSWVENLAKEMHTKAFTLACNQLADKSDLTGQRLVPTELTDANGHKQKSYVQVFYPHVVIQEAINYANQHPDETPILFLDELNRTTPDVTSEALSIPTMRSIGNQKLPANLKVITAGNDKGNVSSLDKASVSRFVLYHVKPDVDTFLQLDDNLNPYIRKVLQMHPEDIFAVQNATVETKSTDDDDDDDDDDDNLTAEQLSAMFDSDSALTQITTPRTITSLSNWLNSFSDHDLATFNQTQDPDSPSGLSLLYTGIIAHVGDTSFANHVADTIDKSISTPAVNTQNVITMPKPAAFDNLLAASSQSVSAIDQVISNLDESSIQNNLIYALRDSHNNQAIISELLSAITQFDKDHLKLLAQLATNSALNEQNVDFALNSPAPSINQISSILAIAN